MGESTLKATVQREMHEALKAGDKMRLGALRMLSAAITNRVVGLAAAWWWLRRSRFTALPSAPRKPRGFYRWTRAR